MAHQTSIKAFLKTGGQEISSLMTGGKRCFSCVIGEVEHDAVKKLKTELRCLPDISEGSGWVDLLKEEFSRPYFEPLRNFISSEISSQKIIYPPLDQVYNAFEQCHLDSIKVVILGQDPYHGAHQAHGLAFSVQQGVQVPPSLRNIYKEMSNDVKCKIPNHGCLDSWASQGVFLLNNVLTVRKGMAYSHKGQGWETFTKNVVSLISGKKEGLVFILWGKPAHLKGDIVDEKKHLIIKSSHPSPLGATKTNLPFIGSRCFSRANKYLVEQGKEPIDWGAL